MKRLAFIRMLHQQAVEQSRLPRPLLFTSILSFHDAVELFLVLACEHRGAQVPKDRITFMKYWELLSGIPAGGVDLSVTRKTMSRLNDVRNNFKHGGSIPGTESVEQSRADVAAFFEVSTPLVFDGLAYGDIDMADTIAQEDVRAHVKEAVAAATAGDQLAAMTLLAQALDKLLRTAGGNRRWSPLRLGPDIDHSMSSQTIAAMLNQPGQYDVIGSARSFGDQIQRLTEAAREMQSMLRVTARGIDFGQYLRFRQLTPRLEYGFLSNEPRILPTLDYAPSEADFDFCHQFVITASLQVAEVTSHFPAPPDNPA